MNQFVIYTVLVGDRDEVRQPEVIDPRFDYILFSDQHIGEQLGVWQVRAFDYQNDDPTIRSRYPKILAHRLLSDYEASLYLDANIAIATSPSGRLATSPNSIYDRVVALATQNIPLAALNHSYHDCLFQEIDWVIEHQLDSLARCERWRQQLRCEGFPEHAGLFENGILFRSHTPLAAQINEQWWRYYLQVSRRDQLTLRYVLWHLGIDLTYLLPPDQTPRHSEWFRYFPH